MDSTTTSAAPARWVGNRLPRREDRRMLRGRGRFTDDVSAAHALHAAFVRSPLAAGTITGIDTSAALNLTGVADVLTSADLGHPGLRAAMERPEFIATTMPLLASDRVRYVGEPVAVVLAEDRYVAEDAAEAVTVEIEEAPAVTDLSELGRDDLPVMHDEAPDGVLVDLEMFSDDLLEKVLADAPLLLTETFRSGRVNATPMEARACMAEWVERDEQLVLTLSTQVPHQVRTGVAHALGISERQVRVIAPDVGGGFGQKCVVGREEVVVAAVAARLHREVRWTEDRQENLTASFHGHEQEYHIRAGFDADGRLLGLDADIRCNIGAYSAFPFTCGVEPLMAASELPGVYKVPRYAARARGFASNKPPTAPYRGVSRPQIVMVMEGLMDQAAGQLGIERAEIRRRNTIAREDFPYTGANGITYEPGSYIEALELCLTEVERAGWWDLRERSDRVLRGIGVANFSERTAYGTATMGMRKMQMTPGFEVAHVRMDASGDVVVTSGTCGHGQGHETTFAQLVADRLGIHPDRVKLRQGDTDLTSFGWGTFGSRSLVIGGGSAAVAANRLADQIRKVAAGLLEADPDDIELVDGSVRVVGAPDARMAIDEVASIVHFRAHTLTEHEEQLLEARGSADPSGMFSNACQAALIEIDPGTGGIQVRDYIVVEDCGVVVNPTIVEGQVRGGIAQGIASALYEEMAYSPDGEPLTGTLMDYLVPTATEIPPIAVHHLETPCDQTETGAKGMGEGGAIGAPAAVLSAINDALRDRGTRLRHLPITPAEVMSLIGTGQEDV